MTTQILKWVKSELSNNESSSNKELIELFVNEGPMSKKEAEAWVAKRSFYMNNIVMDDGSIYKPTV